jgi:hypothetical protein
MIGKNLVEKFQNAFSEPEKVKAEEYQKIVETNATKAADNAERLTFLLLGLVMVFILIIEGQVDKINLGIVEIKDPSIVLIAIPILIAYIHYDLITTLSKFDLLSIIYKAIIRQRHSPIHEQRLTKYFLFLPTLYENKYHSKEGIASILWLVEFVIITIVIPLGGEFYAFLKLIDASKTEYDFLLIASMIITVMLNMQSLLTITTLFRGVGDK